MLTYFIARGGDSGRGDFIRDMGDWTRKGPLEPAAPRGPPRGASEFGERRVPRDPAAEGRPARDLNWERRGPLAPLPQEEVRPSSRDGSQQRPGPEGLGERGGSHRGELRQSPATWGEGRSEGSRPPRREYAERPEKPERAPTAAEKDMQWRERMRPAAEQASPSQEGSLPASPVAAPAVPAGPPSRPRLNLQKRTVSEAADGASPTVGSDSKASPFGAARPIDTATREKQVEEKRQQVLREKREADEKAKEERRLAKEAAAKAETEAAEKEAEAEAAAETEEPKPEAAQAETEEAAEKQPNGGATSEQKVPIRSREPRDASANPKPRGFDAGNWRSAPRGGAGPRGGRGGGAPRGARQDSRQPRANGPPSQEQGAPATSEPGTPTQDEDGWTTVPKKGRQGRPLAS